jgi:hypothetical protein
LFACNWEEEFEFWWKFVFCVESVGEIDSSDSAVGMDLNSIVELYYTTLT